MTGKQGKAHYRGDYLLRARALRANANTNPATLCGRCGEPARPGDPWTAGHVNDGEVGGQLRPEHRSCNYSAGAAYGNRLREPRSERWY